MNKVIMIGRLTKDPDIQHRDDFTFGRLGLAVDRPFKVKGEKVTDFFDVKVTNKTAELAEKYLEKGKQILIEGVLINDNWKKDDGTVKYRDSILVDRIEFVGNVGEPKGSDPKKESQASFKTSGGIPEGFTAIDDDDVPF